MRSGPRMERDQSGLIAEPARILAFFTRLGEKARVGELLDIDISIVTIIACFTYFEPTTHFDFARLKRLNYLSPLLPV